MSFKVQIDGVIRDATPEEIAQQELDVQQDIVRQWKSIREIRDLRLTSSDWTQGNDSPLSMEKKTQWATYRQALRDITEQSDLSNIVWPTIPN